MSKEKQRERMAKVRNSTASDNPAMCASTSYPGIIGNLSTRAKGVTDQGITSYPAIIRALTDLPTRAKLRSICLSLQSKGLQSEVTYGIEGPAMMEVAELLVTTEGVEALLTKRG